MILVIVGIGENQSGFLRLTEEIDKIATKIDEKIIIQIGNSKYIPKNAEYFRFLPEKDYKKLCQEARIIVCHDGAGSIMTAFQLKKLVVVVPRSSKLEERERDENDLAIELEKRQVIKAVWDIKGLESAIKSVSNDGLLTLKSERGNLVHKLREYINNIEKKQKGTRDGN